MEISIGEARDKLTQLIRAVEDGEQVTITRNGTPVVDLVPTKPKQRRVLGALKGLIVDPDWAKSQNDVEAWLRGEV